jgi:L-alanine-DL-glutamate epimerase-like enolase superfamily enzyme/GNAT superfamily N-acetyltransferase
MRLTVHEIRLTQRHIWRSAREAIPVQPALLVELRQDGVTGYGEAAAFMTDRYRSGLDEMHDALRRMAGVLSGLDACDDPARVWAVLARHLPDSPFVLAALDGAVNDLHARLLGVPLWRALGLAEPRGLRSSYSIGLDAPDVMVHKLREQPGFPAYKVKLADPADLTILAALREHTDAPFLVDGNCGWTLRTTLGALDGMVKLGVELIEQPFPREAWEQARELRRAAPVPVFADESMTGPQDLDLCAGAFDGVNVKPMKAGGLTPTLAILRRARELGLQTMLGCMPESAAAVSATAHLGGLVDHLDIDALVLLDVNTGAGARVGADGGVSVPDRPGSGYLPDLGTDAFIVREAPVERVRPIRHRILRPAEPASSVVYPEDAHPGARHFVAVRAGEVVGSTSIYHEDPPLSAGVPGLVNGAAHRLRGMATLPEVRGAGFGAALLRTALTAATLAGTRTVWCNARTTVATFYQRAGFQVLGDEYDLPGIGPHVFMYWRAP